MRRFTMLSLACCFVFLCAQSAAEAGVLKSTSPEEKERESSQLVPANPSQEAPAPKVPATNSTVKMKLRFKPKEHPAPVESESKIVASENTEEDLPQSQESPSPETDSDGLASYLDQNPHATTPAGTSPFIKKVGDRREGYKRNPIVGYGKAKGNSPTGTQFTIREKKES